MGGVVRTLCIASLDESVLDSESQLVLPPLAALSWLFTIGASKLLPLPTFPCNVPVFLRRNMFVCLSQTVRFKCQCVAHKNNTSLMRTVTGVNLVVVDWSLTLLSITVS